jgi:hypothetical protein
MLPLGTLGAVTEFVVGMVVGASAAGLLAIVIAPSRRIRAEKPLPRDTETRVLLGQDPDDPPTGAFEATTSSEPHPEQPYTPTELAQLQRLGEEAQQRRRDRR